MIFDEFYSKYYDVFCPEIDYEKHAKLFKKITTKHLKSKKFNVLDMGCGTGSYTKAFLELGCSVVGVDLSPHMLDIARAKCRFGGQKSKFYVGDISKDLNFTTNADIAIIMGDILSYQLDNESAYSTLENAYDNLVKGGLLFFEVWYGPSVLRDGASVSVRSKETPDGTLVRYAKGSINIEQQKYTTDYKFWNCGDGSEYTSTHHLRFFFPFELELLLQWSGFELLCIGDIENYKKKPTGWHALVIAKKKRV